MRGRTPTATRMQRRYDFATSIGGIAGWSYLPHVSSLHGRNMHWEESRRVLPPRMWKKKKEPSAMDGPFVAGVGYWLRPLLMFEKTLLT